MYSFDIVFGKPKRGRTSTLYDVDSISIGGITILAKNAKYGNFYFSKYIKQLKGRFHYVAGSHSSPILWPVGKQVVISVHSFPYEPVLEYDDFWKEFREHITLANIKKYRTK